MLRIYIYVEEWGLGNLEGIGLEYDNDFYDNNYPEKKMKEVEDFFSNEGYEIFSNGWENLNK